MTHEAPVDLKALLDVAYAAVFGIASPSARSNITDVIAAHAVEQYLANVERGKEIHDTNARVTTAARRRAIDAMSDAEKLDLIEQLAHSVRAPKNGGSKELAPLQKRRLLESVRRIAALPMDGPGRFSGRDHDQVLYAPPGKANSQG